MVDVDDGVVWEVDVTAEDEETAVVGDGLDEEEDKIEVEALVLDGVTEADVVKLVKYEVEKEVEDFVDVSGVTEDRVVDCDGVNEEDVDGLTEEDRVVREVKGVEASVVVFVVLVVIVVSLSGASEKLPVKDMTVKEILFFTSLQLKRNGVYLIKHMFYIRFHN